ncbi:Retinaldehyde-binding protein 1 [Eumeta japonica]|uniref:Retinaldehyde-binding protein 1 n=1 Tax=Eumeta variegata TaxID=151549 RepID=A0A4C1SXQ1_EUMVA|nr:Retinaldehyde-binding protein 1 [Eumeta japonica]
MFSGEIGLNVPIDKNEFIIKFLRPCKFYAKSALEKIKAYYRFRVNHSHYCRDLFPSATRAAFDRSIVSILAPRDQHGRRIMLIESGG